MEIMTIAQFWEKWWEENAHMIRHSAEDVAISFAEAWGEYRVQQITMFMQAHDRISRGGQ